MNKAFVWDYGMEGGSGGGGKVIIAESLEQAVQMARDNYHNHLIESSQRPSNAKYMEQNPTWVDDQLSKWDLGQPSRIIEGAAIIEIEGGYSW